MGVVTVCLPGALRDLAGGVREVPIPVQPGAVVADVLDALDGLHPVLGRRLRDEQRRVRAHVRLYVDGTDLRDLGGTSAPVAAGAELLVVPAVSGG